MEEKVVRKTKRVVGKAAAGAVIAQPLLRKTAASSSVRKAPPRVTVATTKSKQVRSPKILIIGILLFVTLFGMSALIGMSDKGQLDVSKAITERKQNATPEEQEVLNRVPSQQNQNSAPNGGLVGMGQFELPVVQEQLSATTSTTSIATATSSEAVAASSTLEVSSETNNAQ